MSIGSGHGPRDTDLEGRGLAGIAKKPVTGIETVSFKEASDACVSKFTCHGPCQRTQYAGMSTDKCTVRVKFMHWRS